MAASNSRFERQMRLPEVGTAGQARISAGRLRLGSHLDEFGRGVARRYAEGAGITEEATHGDAAPEALSHFRHNASRSVAGGALSALQSMVEALES